MFQLYDTRRAWLRREADLVACPDREVEIKATKNGSLKVSQLSLDLIEGRDGRESSCNGNKDASSPEDRVEQVAQGWRHGGCLSRWDDRTGQSSCRSHQKCSLQLLLLAKLGTKRHQSKKQKRES